MIHKLLPFLFLLATVVRAQTPLSKLPSSAMAMAVDSKDNVIIYCHNGRLVKLAPDGSLSMITDDISKGVKQPPYPGCSHLLVDSQDNILMAGDEVIWKMTPDGKISLFAGVPFSSRVKDGPLATAQFRSIAYIEMDKAGNIYVVDRDDSKRESPDIFYHIRKIDTKGMVTTLTTTRDNAALKTNWIAGLGVDTDGALYLSDGAGRCIKKMTPTGEVSTIAGMCGKRQFLPVYVQGDISKAELMAPQDILINAKGEVIFIDGRLNRIIKVANRTVTTIAGNSEIQPNSVNMGGRSKEGYQDGKALTALFNFPGRCAITIDSKQNIYIIDGGNECIRKLSADGMVTTVAKR